MPNRSTNNAVGSFFCVVAVILAIASPSFLTAADQRSRDTTVFELREKRLIEEETTFLRTTLADISKGHRNVAAAAYLRKRLPALPTEHRTAIFEAGLAELDPKDGANPLAALYFRLSWIYFRQSNLADAIRCQEKAAELATEKDLLRPVLATLVRNLHSYGKLERGVAVNARLIALTQSDEDPIAYVRALTEQGYMLNKLGRDNETREALVKLDALVNDIQEHPSDQGRILRLNGNHWSEVGNLDQAIHYTNLAVSAFEEADDAHEIANCYFNLAIQHKNNDAPVLAEESYRKAAGYFDAAGSIGGLGMVQSAHGRLAYESENYPESLELLEDAVYHLEIDNSLRRLATALSRLSETLEALGREKDADRAKERAQAVLRKLKS